MNISNLLVIIFLAYYTNYLFGIIISKRRRSGIREANMRLDGLRQKSMKTLQEQKDFINMKFPKRQKFRWSWLAIIKIIIRLSFFIVIMRFFYWVFSFYDIELALWQGILFIVVFPVCFNFILEKFKVQKSDMSVFFRGWFKRL